MEGLMFASMELGAPSVMTSGPTLMPVWCAGNWDIHPMVTVHDITLFSLFLYPRICYSIALMQYVQLSGD